MYVLFIKIYIIYINIIYPMLKTKVTDKLRVVWVYL